MLNLRPHVCIRSTDWTISTDHIVYFIFTTQSLDSYSINQVKRLYNVPLHNQMTDSMLMVLCLEDLSRSAHLFWISPFSWTTSSNMIIILGLLSRFCFAQYSHMFHNEGMFTLQKLWHIILTRRAHIQE